MTDKTTIHTAADEAQMEYLADRAAASLRWRFTGHAAVHPVHNLSTPEMLKAVSWALSNKTAIMRGEQQLLQALGMHWTYTVMGDRVLALRPVDGAFSTSARIGTHIVKVTGREGCIDGVEINGMWFSIDTFNASTRADLERQVERQLKQENQQ